MRKIIITLLISIFFCHCSEKNKTIHFVAVNKNDFNAKSLEMPNDNMQDSLKKAHDSCMGFSFDANVFLAQAKDSFFIGSIVNKRSLKVVSRLNDLGLTPAQLIAGFNTIAHPCYEKRVLHFPLKTLPGKNFNLQFLNADRTVNEEINNAISASADAEMETGSWIYLNMKNALKTLSDTAKNAAGLIYRKNLLDSSNIVLTAAECIMDISFIINTNKDLSTSLQAFLKSKPSIPQPNSQSSIKLFYISANKFQLNISGFFPVAGEFMKAELK